MRPLRVLVWAVVLSGLYAAASVLTYRYLSVSDSAASFFPAAGVTLATLLMTPRKTWPVWIAVIAATELSIDLVQGQSVLMAMGFATTNAVEPLIGASVAYACVRRFNTPRGFLVQYVLCGVIVGPLVGSLVGALVTVSTGAGGFASTWSQWWLGDALGVLVVATPVLAWSRHEFYKTSASTLELLGIAAVAGVVTVVPALYFNESFAYAVLPVLMFAGVRGGPVGVGTAGLAFGFGASWVVANGHASTMLAVHGSEGAVVDTQLFIAVTLLSALTLAIEVAERTRAETALRYAETRRARAELAGSHAAASERRRIARETHDIVGHALNVMILSGAAARRILDSDAPQAKQLLATVEEAGRDAFRDLDVALGLTDRSPDFAPPRGFADIRELVDRLVQAGMQVEYDVDGEYRALPKLVDGSVYRIIQESLTNVAKHAGDARVRVHVHFTSSAVLLEVSDRGGRAVAPNSGGGRGLVGMTERVAVLGGHIVAGPRNGGGFAVMAELPLVLE